MTGAGLISAGRTRNDGKGGTERPEHPLIVDVVGEREIPNREVRDAAVKSDMEEGVRASSDRLERTVAH